jgi:hypothetical protein
MNDQTDSGARSLIGQTVSPCRILEKRGAGGRGVVFKAEETTLGGIVTLNFLPQDLVQNCEFTERFCSMGSQSIFPLCSVGPVTADDKRHDGGDTK